MKSKRYSTEAKIRVLREAEKADKSIIEVCKVQIGNILAACGF